MQSGFLKRILVSVLAMALLLFPVRTQAEGNEFFSNRAWLRAKLVYEFEDGITGLSDDIIDFETGWVKQDDWYYYHMPVKAGDRIRFISKVHIPTEWTNDIENKRFKVVVLAEVAEVAPDDTGWKANTDIQYSTSYDIWSMGYTHDEDIIIKEGHTSVKIVEYQLDEYGNEVKYINDKIIVPGESVSKIVEFEIDGERGGLTKLKPKSPVKSVFSDGINVNGAKVMAGDVLEFHITMENPAPDAREITITDMVDAWLTVTDAGGGIFLGHEAGDLNVPGGTLEWKLTVEGYGTGTVSFTAKVKDGVKDQVIGNVAEATIFGKTLKSNAVFVNVGSPSPIKRVIIRATYDPHFLYDVCSVFVGLLFALIVLIVLIKRKKKGDEDETD